MALPADPSLAWLELVGGQAQLTFNDDVDTLAADPQPEDHAPTVANHLILESGAHVVQAEARQIVRTPARLPTVNRVAYKRMLSEPAPARPRRRHHRAGRDRLVQGPERLQHHRLLTRAFMTGLCNRRATERQPCRYSRE